MEKLRYYWGKVWAELVRLKFYILAMLILFGYGIFSGYTSNAYDEMMQSAAQGLYDIADEINSSDNPTQTSIILIFLNNVRVLLFMMALGILLGLLPIFSMLFNGVMIGFMLRYMTSQGVSMSEAVFKGLLPHGILELPVLLVGAAYGVRLGITAIRRLFPSQRERVQPVKEVALAGIPLAVFLILVLLVASIIESTLTKWLLGG